MKALELANELDAVPENGADPELIQEAAAELRRLAAVEADCAPYLKEGETPAERIKRDLGDVDSLMSLYRDVVAERDALKAENALLAEVNAQLREQNDAVGEACAKYEADLEAECEETKRWLVKAQNERDARKELEAELERIKQSWDEWIKKTEWVQETCQPKELGRHRADVLRMRIEALQADLERIKALPPVAWRSSMGHGVTLKESITDDQKALTWDGKPMWQPLIALGSKT